MCCFDFSIAYFISAGRLEDALKEYKRSQQYGVERAAMHIRNVCTVVILTRDRLLNVSFQVSAKILGQRMQAAEKSEES